MKLLQKQNNNLINIIILYNMEGILIMLMIIMDIGFNLADGGITYGIIDMTGTI